MNEPVQLFEYYDRISDDLIYLGTNVVLRFTTLLTKHSDKYGSSSFHKEFEYQYGNSPAITIRRSFDYYLSIENIKMIDGIKESIKITIETIYLFKSKLNQAYQWFSNSKFDGIFGNKNGELALLKNVNPIVISGLPLNKEITLVPIIYRKIDTECTGIRLYLNSESNYVDMTLDKFMGLLYTIDTFNMYLAASNMINYLQRPTLGYNKTSYLLNSDPEVIAEKVTSKKKTRKIVPKNSSFMVKMEGLEPNG